VGTFKALMHADAQHHRDETWYLEVWTLDRMGRTVFVFTGDEKGEGAYRHTLLEAVRDFVRCPHPEGTCDLLRTNPAHQQVGLTREWA